MSETQSLDDLSSLCESPSNRSGISLRKLKPNNRVGSPKIEYDNSNESSIVLSPITRNIFTVSDKLHRKEKHLVTSCFSDTSDTPQILNKSHLSSPSIIETQSIFSSKSDTKSYREKLRDRFLSIKQQAGNSLLKSDTSVKLKKNKTLKLQQVVNSFKQEDDELKLNLENYKKTKAEFNDDFKLQLSKKIASQQFFYQTEFIAELVEEQSDEIETEEDLTSHLKFETNTEEQKSKDLVQLFCIGNNNDIVYDFIQPEHVENYITSDIFIDWSKKQNIDFEVSDESDQNSVENENLNIDKKPKISKKMLNVLSHRLLSMKENQSKWLTHSGKIAILNDPRETYSITPGFTNDNMLSFSVNYKLSENFNAITILNNQDKKYMFEICIDNISFLHHSLFSPEHVLTNKLKYLYNNYQERLSSMDMLQLEKKLASVRILKNNLEEIIKSTTEIIEAHKKKIGKHKIEIKDLRKKILEESKINRDLLKQILKTWKTLKLVREKQKYSNTTCRIKIKKEQCDYNSDKQKWDTSIEMDFNEIMAEKQDEIRINLKKYKEDLKEWKKLNKSLNEVEIEKPEKPNIEINANQIKHELLQQYLESMKPPGEPILHIEMYEDNDVTKDVDYPRERARRDHIKRVKIFVKIYINSMIVCQSKVVSLNNCFTCDINECIPIQTYIYPDNLKIEIYEQHGKIVKLMYSDIIINIPKLDSTIKNMDKQIYFFKTLETINYTHTGVGSGMTFQKIFSSYGLEETNEEELFSNGIFNCKIGWIHKTEEGVHNTFQYNQRGGEHISITQNEQSIINSRESTNACLTELLEKNKLENIKKRNIFRLNPDLEPYEFCLQEFIDENSRFRLLKLRQINEIEFKDMVVPNNLKEIPSNIFNAYEKRKSDEHEAILFKETFNNDSINLQRQWGKYYIKQTFGRIFLKNANENNFTLEDILIEDVPQISSIGSTILQWFQPKRPLCPVRKSPTHCNIMGSDKDIKLIIYIVQAFHVPTQKEINKFSTTQLNNDLTLIPVRPYITVTFQGNTMRTTISEGSNPIWNQELIFPVNFKKQEQLEYLHLQLFDETITDVLEDDRMRNVDLHQRYQSHWLGGLKIPFYTLMKNIKIEGTFKLYSSQLIGYEQNEEIHLQNFSSETSLLQKTPTFITLFITLQPTLKKNEIIDVLQQRDCTEIKYLEQHLLTWVDKFKNVYPNRKCPLLVTNISGKKCCATRYFKPLEPPEFDTDNSQILEKCCVRYVSLIPFINMNDICIKNDDIWLSCDQLLKLLIGSITDHVILLQCFFMSIKLSSWVLFGYGIPYGNTAYIFLKEMDNNNIIKYFIYDVSNGEKYNIHDTFCPLKKVYCLMNNENIWGNIQEDEQPYLLHYDLTKSSEWMPVFNSQISAPMESIQPTQLIYKSILNIDYFRDQLEQKLQTKFMKWRKHRLTVWNRHCNSVFKKMLPLLELFSCGIIEENLNDITYILQNLLTSYKINGFSFHLPYTTTREVINSLKITKLHLNDHPNVEFSLVVYVHPYSNNICSIWIYAASLIRRY